MELKNILILLGSGTLIVLLVLLPLMNWIVWMQNIRDRIDYLSGKGPRS